MFVAAIGSTAAGILLVARDDGKHSSAFAACDNARVCVCGGLTKKIHCVALCGMQVFEKSLMQSVVHDNMKCVVGMICLLTVTNVCVSIISNTAPLNALKQRRCLLRLRCTKSSRCKPSKVLIKLRCCVVAETTFCFVCRFVCRESN